jgi:hypothetical protein
MRIPPQAGWFPALCLAASSWACVGAAQAPPQIELKDATPASRLPHRSPEQYLERVAQLRQLVAACSAKASACDPETTGDDFQVDGPAHFDVRYDWLRGALLEAQKAKDADRQQLMRKVASRLENDAAAISEQAKPLPDQQAAHAQADVILSRSEFRMVTQDNALARQWALIIAMINEGLSRIFSQVPHAPWAVPLVEWGILFLAAVGLLFWAWQTTRQQRLAVAVPGDARQAQWQKESDDWAERAQQQAAAANWREAVHCLYWSAIVMLEGKRLWRANRARTPREYLPLLEAGSARQTALARLTRIFERIWYGLRPAGRADFERAQALLEELKAA